MNSDERKTVVLEKVLPQAEDGFRSVFYVEGVYSILTANFSEKDLLGSILDLERVLRSRMRRPHTTIQIWLSGIIYSTEGLLARKGRVMASTPQSTSSEIIERYTKVFKEAVTTELTTNVQYYHDYLLWKPSVAALSNRVMAFVRTSLREMSRGEESTIKWEAIITKMLFGFACSRGMI